MDMAQKVDESNLHRNDQSRDITKKRETPLFLTLNDYDTYVRRSKVFIMTSRQHRSLQVPQGC